MPFPNRREGGRATSSEKGACASGKDGVVSTRREVGYLNNKRKVNRKGWKKKKAGGLVLKVLYKKGKKKKKKEKKKKKKKENKTKKTAPNENSYTRLHRGEGLG